MQIYSKDEIKNLEKSFKEIVFDRLNEFPNGIFSTHAQIYGSIESDEERKFLEEMTDEYYEPQRLKNSEYRNGFMEDNFI